ncbi:hypothetical protein C2845_PM18G08080 [Panicum miliaceum]|uniref:AAA+ ATPase domain-containing protein n=1 Tax=Panicum miliaceum TaxID=4540 RepID=A0A3L6PLL2_PANMI|nr:hypothetical protein C2845_PM18G08080 [Panicum miliaceum]
MAGEADPVPTPAWWSWFNSVLVLSLIPWLSAVAWRNLQRLQLHHLVGRRASRRVRWLAAFVDPYLTVNIDEHESTGRMMRRGDAYYEEVKAYLGASCSRTARHLRAEGARDAAADRLVLSMIDREEVADHFGGATVWWSAHSDRTASRNGGAGPEERSFKLHYHERHRKLVLDSYLAFVQQRGRDIMVNSRQRKLYTSVSDHRAGWSQVTFKHPMKFDKLAMDPATKKEIMDDLDTFKNGKEHYERVGKAWKRGYLLHGPPGTGKSTTIAAMANHLEYDVYIIELTSVKSNSDLQRLLMEIKSKAVVVIEDIDCSLDLTGAREKKRAAEDDTKNGASTSSSAAKADTAGSKVTLSGLLNVVDGLLSACGEEQVIVFTTNHVEELDRALIRRGRMDKHIKMPYCGFEAFRFLAEREHGVGSHELFDAVRALLGEVDMTPADVIEELTPKSKDDDADSCLAALVKALEKAKEEKANRGSSA